MRNYGAAVADVAVLVVDIDEGTTITTITTNITTNISTTNTTTTTTITTTNSILLRRVLPANRRVYWYH